MISDYSLPQFSGPRALALFKERGIDIPFIVVSGAVGEDAAVALMKSGANDFVTKGNLDRVPPVVRRELADAAVRRRDRLAAAEKQELQSQLLQAQKMEAIGVLTAGVAHDFNNILGAILIYADLAQMKIGKGQRDRQRAGPDHRRHRPRRRPGPPAAAVFPQAAARTGAAGPGAASWRTCSRCCGASSASASRCAPRSTRPAGAFSADSGGIEQVIMNLAVNARDAMQGAGTLTIGLGNVEVVESYCRGVLGARPGPFVRLSVQDTGCGMDQETLQRIFEPFFTTKAVGKGTGLGLSVVYGIVQQHRGWITVRSAPGAGTRFEIFFPPAEDAGVAAARAAPSLDELAGGGERILLVEDEESYRTVAAEALRANGYEVVTAAGAVEAERRVREAPGAFDLVFSDVALGDGDGFDLAGRIRALSPRTRVLLTSGYTDETSQITRIRAAGIPFIAKPYSLPALLIVIRELLRRSLA